MAKKHVVFFFLGRDRSFDDESVVYTKCFNEF